MTGNREWTKLHETEFYHRGLIFEKSQRGEKPSAEELRTWWTSVQILLKEFTIQVARGNVPDPLPASLADVISGLAGYLAVGKLPDPIRFAVAEGRTSPGPTEARHIGWAIAYKKAAAGGIEHNGELIVVDDKSPTKTICDKFGVKQSTVRGWVSKYPPAFLGVNRIDADTLTHRMEDAGAEYKSKGRSHNAIQKRGKPNEQLR